MIECKSCASEHSKVKKKSDNTLSFSEKFLHTGALRIKDYSIQEVQSEVNKISRLFDSIFYLKHYENRIAAGNLADVIIRIIKENIISNNRKNLLKIKGPLGSYKNRLLQYIYLLIEKEDNGILPFYIDLSMYEKSIEKGSINEKSELENLVREHFEQIKNIISSERDSRPIIIIDGIRDFSSGHDRIYSITKRCIEEINCKVIVSLDTDFTSNHKFTVHPLSGSDFEFFVRITSMNTFNKEACMKFIKDCLDTFQIPVPSNGIDEVVIYDRLVKLNIINLDAYWISTLLREMLGNILNPELTISDLFEVLCKKELDDSQINSAAQLAYDYEYGTADFSNSDFYFDVRWKMMRKHRSVLDYLIARYYVLKFEEFNIDAGENVEKQLQFFSMILPKSITVFVTPMINKIDVFETKILKFASRYYGRLSTLEKNQIIFLLGRLKNRTSIEESKSLLKEYYREAQRIYSIANNTIAEKCQNALLLRTISVSLIALGEKNIAENYFDLLLYDKISNEVNRAFHLIYYGDKPYIPNKTQLELSDDSKEGKLTLNVLCASISNKLKTHSFNSMLMLELFTLCSLLQARIDVAKGKKALTVDKYAKNAMSYLDAVLSGRKIREYEKLRAYFHWMKSELSRFFEGNQKYSPAEIYNVYNNAPSIKRTGWIRRGIREPENIVEHMYNCWLMAALYLPDEIPESSDYDKSKVLNMLLIHDLGEYHTGDIARSDKEKNQLLYDVQENEIMQGLLLSGTYPQAQSLHFLSVCWDDWFYTKDINYEIAKDIDTIQAIYQFCKYYLIDSTIFELEDAREWIDEIYEIKTSVCRSIVKKLILDNPSYSDILEKFGGEYEYYE